MIAYSALINPLLHMTHVDTYAKCRSGKLKCPSSATLDARREAPGANNSDRRYEPLREFGMDCGSQMARSALVMASG
jgi:hypothetical protein